MEAVNTNVLRDLGFLRENEVEKNQNQLNQESFLTLMTTQLMNQNPTKPMDNGQFLGQMAQFSTVSGIQDLDKSIKGLLNNSLQNQRLQATSIVGKEVLVTAGTFENIGAKTIQGEVNLNSSADRLEIKVYNSANAVVRTIPSRSATVGQHSFTWDGRNDAGNAVNDGQYRFVAEVTRNDNVSVTPVSVYDNVESIAFNDNGSIELNLTHQGSIDF